MRGSHLGSPQISGDAGGSLNSDEDLDPSVKDLNPEYQWSFGKGPEAL
jgi:hypothetical protein